MVVFARVGIYLFVVKTSLKSLILVANVHKNGRSEILWKHGSLLESIQEDFRHLVLKSRWKDGMGNEGSERCINCPSNLRCAPRQCGEFGGARSDVCLVTRAMFQRCILIAT